MKDKRAAVASAEVNCQHLGDLALVAVAMEMQQGGLEQGAEQWAEQWAEIDGHLGRRWRGPALRRHWPVLAVCAAVVLCVAGWLVARRPLGYQVVNCTQASDGVFATTLSREGAIAFEDGSRMSVQKDARFRLGMLPFGHGADISLDEGEAQLSVVHRDRASWSVQAGPFRVEVTGTRFGVRWSQQLGRFRVTMLEGEVLVAGGAIPPATHLRAGQILTADLSASSFAIANAPTPPAEAPPTGTADPVHSLPAGIAKQDSTGPRGVRQSVPRKRVAVSARDENSSAAAPEPRQRESVPVPALSGPGEPLGASVALQPLPPAPSTAQPTPPVPTLEPKLASVHVIIGETGKMANGFTGAAWVASGEGITFSTPALPDERTHLRIEGGQLCTSGTVAGLACVNEGTPNLLCNWDRNWGVAIGWHTRSDQNAWGEDAKGSIAIEFHGRSASYRLNAHLKGDPNEQMYCIENYKSGQVVRPSMFKSECWFNKGDTLTDFQRVDLFQLQFPSGMSYVGFRYCISGITLYP